MYSRGDGRTAKHGWQPSADSIGIPSYLAVQVYTHLAGTTYSSNSCKSLDCPTFLRVAPTHVVFSLGGFALVPGYLDVPGSQPISIVTLSADAAQLVNNLRARATDIGKAVDTLCKLSKQKATPGPAAAHNEYPMVAGVDMARVWAVVANEESEDHAHGSIYVDDDVD